MPWAVYKCIYTSLVGWLVVNPVTLGRASQVSVAVEFLGVVLGFFVPVAQAGESASHFISSMRGNKSNLGGSIGWKYLRNTA